MKVNQNVITGYNRVRLWLLSIVSVRRAAAEAWVLMCTPFNGKNIAKTPPLFHSAQPVEFTIRGFSIKGFHFTPSQNERKKKILICHGFDSSSYRFAKYVPSLLNAGFEVFAFDAPGHGFSDGRTVNAFIYRDIVLQVEKLFGPFYGIMAHSLGALAAALATEEIGDPDKKLVLIAPATEVKTIFQNFFKTVPITKHTRQAFNDLVFESTGRATEWFSVSRAVENMTCPVLWIHDTEDPMCPYADTLPVREKNFSHVRFITTEGLGHTRIYISRDTHDNIIQFFAEED